MLGFIQSRLTCRLFALVLPVPLISAGMIAEVIALLPRISGIRLVIAKVRLHTCALISKRYSPPLAFGLSSRLALWANFSLARKDV